MTVVFNKALSFVLHQGACFEEHWFNKGHHLIMIICWLLDLNCSGLPLHMAILKQYTSVNSVH